MTDCPNCGFNAGESKFCPNCGTKIENEKPKSLCPNCGFDAGESKFCPNCGTKIGQEKPKSFCHNCGAEINGSKFCPNCGSEIDGEKIKKDCPNCGKSLNIDAEFCPYCGWSESKNDSDNIDKLIDVDNQISGKFFGALGKSKTFDKFLDKTANLSKKFMTTENSLNKSYWESIEPIFLEALDTLDDEYVKTILLIERRGLSSTAGVAGLVIGSVYTPTKHMTNDEAISFYQEWADNIAADINKEKQNGTFDADEYYKKRLKESTLENASFIGIPQSYKNWKDDQD